jgi:hypothetical protein
MKRLIFIPAFLCLFLLSGCSLVSKLTDLTDTANQLLESIGSISRQIDSQLQSGQLEENIGNLIDERLNELAELINNSIQNNGGFLFDQANGMINNIFSNISQILDQVKTGILDESLPNLINQISMQLQVNINLLSSSLEDLVTLTFGNTFILLDKTTNSMVIIFSIIFLAVGLFVYAIILISRKERKMNVLRWIGLSFMLVYVGFFAAMVLSPKLRGNLIAGFDFGQKYQGVQTEPKITSVFPETFVIGKNDKIFIYGKHLNKIDTLAIRLRTGQTDKFTFPSGNIIVQSAHKIVLGNFGKLNWKAPLFKEMAEKIPLQNKTILNTTAYQSFASDINSSIYPHVRAREISAGPVMRSASTRMGSLSPVITIKSGALKEKYNLSARQNLGVLQGTLVMEAMKGFFLSKFKLPEGDYALTVLSGKSVVTSPQLITIFNPPPPAPLPDIFPTGLNWTHHVNAVAGEQTSLEVALGFTHPEEIKNGFDIRINSAPPLTPLTIEVPMGSIVAASGSNTAILQTRTFPAGNPGNYQFTVTVDPFNKVTEKAEGNNILTTALPVNQYVYDAVVTFLSFTSKENMDNGSEDEYRIDIRTSVTGHDSWKIDFDKDGEPGRDYTINQSRSFANLKPGTIFIFQTTGKESDSGFNGDDDGMGSFSTTHTMGTDPTNGGDSREFSVVLETGRYKVLGRYILTRRII